jgi:hypothetical protein
MNSAQSGRLRRFAGRYVRPPGIIGHPRCRPWCDYAHVIPIAFIAVIGSGRKIDWRLIVPLLVLVVVLFFVLIIAVGVSRRHRVIYEDGKPPVGQNKNVLRHALSPLAPVGYGDPHRRMGTVRCNMRTK